MWVVVGVIVVGGIWWWAMGSQPVAAPTSALPSANPPSSNPPANQTPSTTPNGISATDNSNAALQTNLASIDSQMNGFSSDNTNITQSENDQPVSQQQL